MTIHITSQCTELWSKEINAHSIFTPQFFCLVLNAKQKANEAKYKFINLCLCFSHITKKKYIQHTYFLITPAHSKHHHQYEAAFFPSAIYILVVVVVCDMGCGKLVRVNWTKRFWTDFIFIFLLLICLEACWDRVLKLIRCFNRVQSVG